MSIDPNPQEFDHLQDAYIQTCDAFERGDLTSIEARDTIVNLRHTDVNGVEWKIDTKRSGRRATFIRVDGLIETPQPSVPAPTGFDLMDHQYRNLCAAFDRGELTAIAARQEVMALRFTDSLGRTWKIDTQRSGKRAAFVQEKEQHLPDPLDTVEPVREQPIEIEQTPVPDLDNDFRDDGSRQLRFKEILVAAVTIVVGLVILLSSNEGDTSPATSSSSPTISTPLPTIPTNTAVTYPLLTSFSNRSMIPTNAEIEFGRSVLNRPLTVIRRGNPDGVRVMVVGCIHGTECAGLAVIDLLKSMAIPANIDLWILPNLNPDGYALNTRQNANKVDMNRNFPIKWKPLGEPGYWQWSGSAPATEPEVKAVMDLGKLVQPQLTIWYHQDYFRISPGSGSDGEIRKRYANLVDLPVLKIEGGSYSGTAAMWAETMNKNDTTSLTVEFGKGLRPGEAQANANAIITVVGEFFPD